MVKSLKNQGTIVHRLPNEILRLIFTHLVSRREAYSGYELYAYRGRKTGVDTGTILRLTHVCRRWRDLLLDWPSVWARTGCFFAEGTRTFLERSGSAPLSLALSDDDPNAEDILAKHGSRLKRLDLAISEGSDFPSLLPIISPWPSSLECLTIYAERRRGTDGPRRTSSLRFSPPSLDGLKALALAPAPYWLPSNHFPALTHLTLDGGSEMRLPNVKSLLTLLMNSPTLQFIHIAAVDLDDKDDTIPPSTPTIALNQLRSLVFVSCEVETFDLLNYLSIPRHACLRIHDAEVQDSGRLRVPFLPLMEDLEELEIATEGAKVHVVATDGRSRGFWLQGSAEESVSWKPWICDTLPATIPLSSITSLRVYLGDDLAILPTVLSHMPKLSELWVSFPYSHPDESNHMPLKPSAGADAPADVGNQSLAYEAQGCLNLRHIHLEVVLHFDQVLAVYTSEDDAAAFTGMCPPILVRIMATRAKAGLPVSLLTVQPVVSAENIYSRQSAVDLRPVIGRAFVPVEQYVEELTVHPVFVSWDRTTRIFEMKSLWNIDGAEEYWDLDVYEKPKYDLPCP